MFRKAIFWLHLSTGVTVGLVVFSMSLTGVLLTYERQFKRWTAESHYVPVAQRGTQLPLEQLLSLQRQVQPEFEATTAIITNDKGAPISLRAGRRGSLDLNPYDGTPMQVESVALNDFFGVITRFHRWFNIEGEHRDFARQVTGVSNVLFLFLVMSGMYLWLPAMWKRALFKARLWLRKDYPDSKTRDFHWHHVFGIWMAIPLLAVVYSGAVMSYPWAANLMYRVFGAEIPVQQAGQGRAGGDAGRAQGREGADGGGPRGQRGAGRQRQDGSARDATGSVAASENAASNYLPLDTLVANALADKASAGWERLTLTLPAATATSVQIEIDRGNGAQAQKRHTLSLDRSSGAITGKRTFMDTPDAQRIRGISRFLHTGEVLGFWGQTIAGLASAAALLLVWTGLSLAWRRLIQPLYKRKG